MSSVVFALPPCPACRSSWCLPLRVVRIPMSFFNQIIPWYHKRSSFHWHSPSAISIIWFLRSSKFPLMSWISSSLLLAFCVSPSPLSWNSVLSNTSRLIYSVSGISQYRSFGNRIPTFCLSILSPAVGRCHKQ